MSAAELVTGQPSVSRNRLVLLVYTAAIFVSALLLFSVQPLFTKMVLPRLGGSPAVWSVAMVFFQSLLLAGYVYAHLLMRIKGRLIPILVHLVLLLVAFAALPLAIASRWGEPPTSGYAIWLLGLFVASIGLPFLRSPRTTRCCKPGSSAPAIPMAPILISSMPPPISAASSRCYPIRLCSSRSSH